MIIRQKDNEAELRRMLIESGADIVRDTNTYASFIVTYTDLRNMSVFNLSPLLQRMLRAVNEFHEETGLSATNVRISGTLYNRAAENSQVETIVTLDGRKDKGFIKPHVLTFNIEYPHDGPVDVRDTIQTGVFCDNFCKILKSSEHGVEVKINGHIIERDLLNVKYSDKNLSRERIKTLYVEINKQFFSKLTDVMDSFNKLYARRHECTSSLGNHSRKILSSMGFFTGSDVRWFWTKDPESDDVPAEVEFYSLPRHILKMSDVCKMYKVISTYVYPDADTKYRMDVQGRLVLDTTPDEMREWMSNPEFKISDLEFLRDKMDETDKCSVDDFFETLYDERPGWRLKYD